MCVWARTCIYVHRYCLGVQKRHMNIEYYLLKFWAEPCSDGEKILQHTLGKIYMVVLSHLTISFMCWENNCVPLVNHIDVALSHLLLCMSQAQSRSREQREAKAAEITKTCFLFSSQGGRVYQNSFIYLVQCCSSDCFYSSWPYHQFCNRLLISSSTVVIIVIIIIQALNDFTFHLDYHVKCQLIILNITFICLSWI